MMAIRMGLLLLIFIGLVGMSAPAVSISRFDDKVDPPDPPVAKSDPRIEELGRQLAGQITINSLLMGADNDSAKLRVRVLELESRIAVLERQLNNKKVQSIPDTWIPRTFNGMQYYIVPCDEKPGN